MPFLPYDPSTAQPVDPRTAVVFLVAFLLIIGAVAILATWAAHRQKDQHRHGHQH